MFYRLNFVMSELEIEHSSTSESVNLKEIREYGDTEFNILCSSEEDLFNFVRQIKEIAKSENKIVVRKAGECEEFSIN